MKTEKLEFRGGNYMSLLPFTVFIITTIALSFANFQDISMMVGAGVVGLLIVLALVINHFAVQKGAGNLMKLE